MYRIQVSGECYVGYEQIEKNIAYSSSLGLPVLEQISKKNEGPLAVVGGGPSAFSHLEELRNWPGKIWAINGTHKWLVDNGINPIFFSVDPGEELIELADGVKQAVLASHCDPGVFNKLKDAEVLIFHSEHAAGAKKPL